MVSVVWLLRPNLRLHKCVFLFVHLRVNLKIELMGMNAFLVLSLQTSELDDILNDLQNAQPQLFGEPRPVSLPSPMDKQNIINDILQMSETNPSVAVAQQQQHRGMGAGMGPASKCTLTHNT